MCIVVEKFLNIRGVLKPATALSDPKDALSQKLVNSGNFLNENALNQDEADAFAQQMKDNTEELEVVKFDANKMNYKQNLLKCFKEMEDPFEVEFIGDKFDYEQNPADPSHP